MTKVPTIVIVVFTYCVLGLLWIWLSDYLLQFFGINYLQSAKGTLFIVITTAALYLILRVYEKKLKSSELSLTKIFNAFPQPAWVFDEASLKIIIANKTWYNILEFEIGEPAQMQRILSSEDIILMLRNAATAEDGLFGIGICEYNTKTGKSLFMETYGYKTMYHQKNVFVIVGIDATDHVLMQQKLMKQEEKLAKSLNSLKDVAYIQSHELRKPVANIIGLVNLAEVHNNSPKELSEILAMLKASAAELDDTIKVIVNKTYYTD